MHLIGDVVTMSYEGTAVVTIKYIYGGTLWDARLNIRCLDRYISSKVLKDDLGVANVFYKMCMDLSPNLDCGRGKSLPDGVYIPDSIINQIVTLCERYGHHNKLYGVSVSRANLSESLALEGMEMDTRFLKLVQVVSPDNKYYDSMLAVYCSTLKEVLFLDEFRGHKLNYYSYEISYLGEGIFSLSIARKENVLKTYKLCYKNGSLVCLDFGIPGGLI